MTAPNYLKMRPNVDIVLFSENLRAFMASKNSFSKLWMNSCVLHSIVSFCTLIANSNHSKVQMPVSKNLSEPALCIRLLPNVPYVIEGICFKENSVTLGSCLFLLFLSTFTLFSVKTVQTFLLIVYNIILCWIFWKEPLLGFGAASFYTRFCDFCI